LDSFEPYLTRLQNLDPEILEEAASRIPPEWYRADTESLGALLNALLARRSIVAELILACHRSARKPFPNWKDETAPCVVT
jgi:hypothetical protein